MMKTLIARVALAFVLMAGTLTTIERADAQDNWIRCQHIPTGNIQMFPGMACPANWVAV